MEHESFQYTYSAKEQDELHSIRSKYIPQEESKLDQLRRLDAKVTQKAAIASILTGLIGVLIMGFGMSLCMTNVGELLGLGRVSMACGIPVGLIGMVLAVAAYPLYLRRLKKERTKAAPEILRLTDELMSRSGS